MNYDRIDELLKEKGMSRRQLAIQAGISVNNMSGWFTRRTSRVADTHIKAIADVLGVHYVWIKFTDEELVDLLKEQETTYAYNEYTNPACTSCGFRPFAGYIPTLKWMQERGYRYCPGCGKAVEWDD